MILNREVMVFGVEVLRPRTETDIKCLVDSVVFPGFQRTRSKWNGRDRKLGARSAKMKHFSSAWASESAEQEVASFNCVPRETFRACFGRFASSPLRRSTSAK